MTNTNEIKVTRVEAMNICKALVENSDRADKDKVIEVLDKLVASFSKKSESKADKARAKENDRIADTIIEVLADGRKRVSDITKSVNDILGTDYSSNKVSAQVTILKREGSIKREVEKKVAYFTVA